jgi:hypothetical protein
MGAGLGRYKSGRVSALGSPYDDDDDNLLHWLKERDPFPEQAH